MDGLWSSTYVFTCMYSCTCKAYVYNFIFHVCVYRLLSCIHTFYFFFALQFNNWSFHDERLQLYAIDISSMVTVVNYQHNLWRERWFFIVPPAWGKEKSLCPCWESNQWLPECSLGRHSIHISWYLMISILISRGGKGLYVPYYIRCSRHIIFVNFVL